MDDILTLILLSLAMLVGCYLSGMLPLTITFSEEKLKLVTVLGAGLLVGTALAVIIPEGVHAMYESGGAEHHAHHIQKEAVNAPVPDSAAHSKQAQVAAVAAAKPAAEEEHHHHNMGEEHTRIGICLVIGFIFMLLVDQIGGGHAHSPPGDAESGGTSLAHNRNKITATLGLVVHAAADGVALGAAITLAKNDITMIVFLAIMLHKAPAAFGLASFLLHQKFDIPRIRKHLLMFALAAPIMAIITYCGLSQQNKEQLSDSHTTGYAMLFSAGTFLYVATVHVLPEITTSHVTEPLPDGKLIVREHKGLRKQDLAALVIGSIAPLFLSIGHKH